MAILIYTYPLMHLFTDMHQNFGGIVWVGGVVKVAGGGGRLVKLHDSYSRFKNILLSIIFRYNTNIWQGICV